MKFAYASLLGILLIVPACAGLESWLYAPVDGSPPAQTQEEIAKSVETVQSAAVADLAKQGLTPETATKEQVQEAIKDAAEAELIARSEAYAAATAASPSRELSPVASAILTGVTAFNPGWGAIASLIGGVLVLARPKARAQLVAAAKSTGSALEEAVPYEGHVNAPEAASHASDALTSLVGAALAAVFPSKAVPAAAVIPTKSIVVPPAATA